MCFSMGIREIYKLNKSAKVGDECTCPSCKSVFIKEHYQQAFCKSKGKTKCKDKYWNTVTPSKRNNTTRISPASARWSANCKLIDWDIEGSFHPFDSYSLGQE